MTAIELVVVLFAKPTLVLALAAVLAACLRRQPAAARHTVWAAAIVATLAIPALSLLVPEIRIPVLPAAVERLSPVLLRSGSPSSTVADARVTDVVSQPVARRQDANGSAERGSFAIVILWLLGASLFGAQRIVAALRVRTLLARTRAVTDPRIRRLFHERASAREARGEVRIGDEIPAPATAGVLTSVIVLPPEAVHWADADLSAVFAHELGHVVRHDCLVHLIADLAATLYWCNPVVHLAVRRMKSESERACDDCVLRSEVGPSEYARLLLRIAAARTNREIADPAIAMARPRELESRLLAVLDERISRRSLPRWKTMILAGVAMLGSLPAAAFTLGAARIAAEQILAPEPDRLGDALSGPASERLASGPSVAAMPDTALALAGPDSVLARRLVAGLRHVPSHEGDLIRDRAAWALSQARDGHLVEPLLAALYDPDWRVRAYAAWALAGTGDPRIVPRLVELLDHPVWRMRAMAAFAIRESGDPRAEAAMTVVLTDPAWQVRVEAVEYFAAQAGPAFHERLVPRLTDRHVAVRLAAERALTPH